MDETICAIIHIYIHVFKAETPCGVGYLLWKLSDIGHGNVSILGHQGKA
jgi:hypothetical protein